MPAVSKAQQQAAGAALAAKRSGKGRSGLKGASREMYDMSEDELEKFTGTSTKGLPDKVEERLREYIRNVISKSLTEDYSGKINSWKNTQGQSANSAGANAEALKPNYDTFARLFVKKYGKDIPEDENELISLIHKEYVDNAVSSGRVDRNKAEKTWSRYATYDADFLPDYISAIRDLQRGGNVHENGYMKKTKPLSTENSLTKMISSVIDEVLAEDDKWIQGAVNPEHKGYCTPMSKDTCTPKRKALAKRFKKGIDEDGNIINEDGGVYTTTIFLSDSSGEEYYVSIKDSEGEKQDDRFTTLKDAYNYILDYMNDQWDLNS